MSLHNRRVLVTGAAGGVGRAVCRQLVAAGSRIVMTDRNVALLDRAMEELGHPAGVSAIAADLGTPEGMRDLFGVVDAELDGLDILVACAGVGAEPLMAFTDDAWRDVIASNLVSHVACTRAAVERMRRGADGTACVILLGSISVHIKAVGESVYNAAKGGVASFAETLRKELIPDRIRVTLIEPGAIASTMQPFTADERARRVASHQLLSPDEVADAVMFAASRPPGVDCVTLRIEPMDQKIC